MYLSEIPAYRRAIKRADQLEDLWRERAFLGLTETLRFGAGKTLEVLQLTLRMFIELCAVRSPFFVGGRVGPQHIVQILWRVSPDYLPRNKEARRAFVASIADLSFERSVRAISRYLDRMLIDRPPTSAKASNSKADTSFTAALIHELASAYGWSDDHILDTPMPRLFQYLRKIQHQQTVEAGNQIVRFNPLRDKLGRRVLTRAGIG